MDRRELLKTVGALVLAPLGVLAASKTTVSFVDKRFVDKRILEDALNKELEAWRTAASAAYLTDTNNWFIMSRVSSEDF